MAESDSTCQTEEDGGCEDVGEGCEGAAQFISCQHILEQHLDS